jgi:hypothetical protein
MCRICEGIPLDFNGFRNQVLLLRQAVIDIHSLVQNAIQVDNRRVSTGDEWGEPTIYNDVVEHIFRNPNPDEGLLLMILCCWLDMQQKYKTVWTTFLRQSRAWINGQGNIPRGNFPLTASHLLLTQRTINNCGNSISRWLVKTIINIVERNGQQTGNLYRFAGEMCGALYNKNDMIGEELKGGQLPNNFSGGDHKRFWMLIMFLRRDNSVVKCLISRALSQHPDGQRAITYWYNTNYFNPNKCELPVDRRVFDKWNNLWLNLDPNLSARNTPGVAEKARNIAHQHDVSPSIFDAILFF